MARQPAWHTAGIPAEARRAGAATLAPGPGPLWELHLDPPRRVRWQVGPLPVLQATLSRAARPGRASLSWRNDFSAQQPVSSAERSQAVPMAATSLLSQRTVTLLPQVLNSSQMSDLGRHTLLPLGGASPVCPAQPRSRSLPGGQPAPLPLYSCRYRPFRPKGLIGTCHP